jgi:hypothetical protein
MTSASSHIESNLNAVAVLDPGRITRVGSYDALPLSGSLPLYIVHLRGIDWFVAAEKNQPQSISSQSKVLPEGRVAQPPIWH